MKKNKKWNPLQPYDLLSTGRYSTFQRPHFSFVLAVRSTWLGRFDVVNLKIWWYYTGKELNIKHIAAQLSLLCTAHDPFCDQPPHLCRIRSKLPEVIEGVRNLRTINNNFASQGIQRHHSLQMYRSVVALRQIPSCKSIANGIEWWKRCMIISAGTRHDNCPKFYTARFSSYKFHTAKVRNLRHFSWELTA